MKKWFELNKLTIDKINKFIKTGIPITLIITLSYYPIYYGYLHYRALVLQKDFKKEMVYDISDIRKKGNYKEGFYLFFQHKMIPVLASLLISPIPFVKKLKIPITILSTIYAYIYLINSNLTALNIKEGIIQLNSVKDFKENVLKKESYKGFFYFGITSLLLIIPFFNYFAFKFETLRLTYTLGPYYGHDFKDYKECRKYLDENDLYEYGKSRYNFYLNFYNLISVLGLIYFLMKRKQINLEGQKKNILDKSKLTKETKSKKKIKK